MKKYFKFDEEPISGSDYLLRVIIGSFLVIALVGIWLLSATGYKRAGAIGLNKNQRILAAILIPALGIANLISNLTFEGGNSSFLMLFIVVTALFHLGLLLINGNKNNNIQLPTFNILDSKIGGFEKIEIRLKYDSYNRLDFQILGYLIEDFKEFNFKANSKLSFQVFDENNKVIHGKYILLKTFETSNYNPYIKNGIYTFESSMKLTKEQFLKITTCNLIEE